MSPEKYAQLWEGLIFKAIKEYLEKYPDYELKVSETKLKKDIFNIYHCEFNPSFKVGCMVDDLEAADEMLFAFYPPFFPSSSRICTLRIFPLMVFGSSVTNSIILGYLYGVDTVFT